MINKYNYLSNNKYILINNLIDYVLSNNTYINNNYSYNYINNNNENNISITIYNKEYKDYLLISCIIYLIFTYIIICKINNNKRNYLIKNETIKNNIISTYILKSLSLLFSFIFNNPTGSSYISIANCIFHHICILYFLNILAYYLVFIINKLSMLKYNKEDYFLEIVLVKIIKLILFVFLLIYTIYNIFDTSTCSVYIYNYVVLIVIGCLSVFISILYLRFGLQLYNFYNNTYNNSINFSKLNLNNIKDNNICNIDNVNINNNLKLLQYIDVKIEKDDYFSSSNFLKYIKNKILNIAVATFFLQLIIGIYSVLYGFELYNNIDFIIKFKENNMIILFNKNIFDSISALLGILINSIFMIFNYNTKYN